MEDVMNLLLMLLLSASTLAPLAIIWFAPEQRVPATAGVWKDQYPADDRITAIYASAVSSLDKAA
jgi:hypothetical protein